MTTTHAGLSVIPYVPGAGYWIAPSGHVLRVATRHIAAVCEYPEAFGVTREALRALFQHFQEAWASELSARGVVICALVQQGGWIRIRHYRGKRGYWSVNMPDFAEATRARVTAFLCAMRRAGAYDDRVRLDTPASQRWSTIDSLLTEPTDIRGPTVTLTPVKTVRALPTAVTRVHLM